MRKVLLLVCVLSSLIVNAQWKLGLGGGASLNLYSYQERELLFLGFLSEDNISYQSFPSWGVSTSVYGQYDFNKHFGVRADLNWTQKNIYRRIDSKDYNTYFKIKNGYVQLPIMVTYGWHLGRVKLYLNLGVYGSYWMSSTMSSDMDFADYKGVNSEYDNRFDYGLVGGGGVGFYISDRFSVQIETHCFYSTVSTKKEINGIKYPRYNTTFVIQPTICYVF